MNISISVRYIVVALLLCSCSCLWGQGAPAIEWERTWGGSNDDEAYGIDRSSDGGIFLVGRTHSNNGDVYDSIEVANDAWLVKQVDGLIAWQRVFHGADFDCIYAVRATNDGGCIVVGGSYSNDGVFAGNNGMADGWIARVDAGGGTLWTLMLGGSGMDNFLDVAACADGNYLVVGYSGSTDGDVVGNHGETDGWAVKVSSDGEFLWQVCLGGSDSEGFYSTRQTTDGGFILSGSSSSVDGQVIGNHGSTDAWAVYLDAEGEVVWSRCYGGSEMDYAESARQCTEGSFLVTGWCRSEDGDVTVNHGNDDIWVLKIDLLGNIIWQRCFGGANVDRASDIEVTTDGRYLVLGKTYSNNGDAADNHSNEVQDLWAAKVDTSGQLIWSECLGGTEDEIGHAVCADPGGGVFLCGSAKSNDGDVAQNSGNKDMWIVKLGADPVGFTGPESQGISVFLTGAGFVTITSDQLLRKAVVRVRDVQGRELRNEMFTGDHYSLELPSGAFGLHLVTVDCGALSVAQPVYIGYR